MEHIQNGNGNNIIIKIKNDQINDIMYNSSEKNRLPFFSEIPRKSLYTILINEKEDLYKEDLAYFKDRILELDQ